jgi:nitrate/nitrite transporter NarK
MVLSISYQVPAAMGVEVAEALGLSAAQLTSLATACMLGFAVGPAVGGYVDARVGPRANTLVWLGVQAFVGCLFLWGHGSYEIVLVLRAVQGFAGGMLVPSLLGSVNAWFSRRGAACASGVTVGSMGMGFTVAHGASVALLARGWTWYQVMAGCTCAAALAAMACAAVGLARFERSHPGFARYDQMLAAANGMSREGASLGAAAAGRPATMGAFADTGLFWLMVAYCVIKSAFTAGIPAVFPQYLAEEFGLGSAAAAAVTGGAYIASVAGAPLGGLLSGYLFGGRRWQVMAAGALLAAVTLAWLPLVDDPAALRSLLFVCYGATALGTGAFWSLTTEVVVPQLAARASGVLTSAANIGGTAVPLVLVVAVPAAGSFGAVFFALAVLAVVQLACAWAIHR